MTITAELKELSCAEDFFQYLGVPADPAVVRVKRLHILQRMHDYLARAGGDAGVDDETLRARYREALERAYADLSASSPQQAKVFKVFHQAEGTGFVPVERIVR